MQELYILVVSRFKRLQQISSNFLMDGDYFRLLKEEEKMRCEKQNFLLNILKTTRTYAPEQKIEYFDKSLQIMKVINSKYVFRCITPQQIKINFMESFIELYKKYFEELEQTIQFKTKIRSFIRPNNHNIINDLVKFLVDFSRDYYQHGVLWQSHNKVDQNRITSHNQRKKLKPIISENLPSTSSIDLLSPTLPTSSASFKKKTPPQLYKNYDILCLVLPLPCVNNLDKSQLSRLKANQIYREIKMRNVSIKYNYERYRIKYYQKFDIEEYDCGRYVDKTEEAQEFPFYLVLNTQKNGFSCLVIEERKIKMIKKQSKKQKQKPKQKDRSAKSQLNVQKQVIQKSETKNAFLASQPGLFNNAINITSTQSVLLRNRASQYLINSLRVLKLSQSFLPPLLLKNRLQSFSASKHEEINQNKNLRYFNAQVQNEEKSTKLEFNRLKSIKQNFRIDEITANEDKVSQWLQKVKSMKKETQQRKKSTKIVL